MQTRRGAAMVRQIRRWSMPMQQFAPMMKDFPTFDCDAHVTEPPWIWERAKDWLTKDELEALKTTMWFDAETKQLIVNGHAGAGLGSQRIGGTPGIVNVLSLAGPGLKHDIQGIDQVMVIPTDIDTYPWLQNAVGAKAMCKAYNEWAYEYCQADPERLYFAAMLPLQDPTFT